MWPREGGPLPRVGRQEPLLQGGGEDVARLRPRLRDQVQRGRELRAVPQGVRVGSQLRPQVPRQLRPVQDGKAARLLQGKARARTHALTH